MEANNDERKAMNVLGFCIFNTNRNAWLQDDEKSWGSFADVAVFTNEETATEVSERVSGDEVTFTMAILH